MSTEYPEQVVHAAQRLLEAIGKGFANQGVALPTRQLLYAGATPPVDFDDQDDQHPGLLAIGLGPITPGTTGQTVNTGVLPSRTIRSAVLRVWLFRPVSRITDQGDLPLPSDMTADAVVVFTDSVVLLGALESARETWAVNGRNTGYALGPIQPVTVQGGYAGNTANVTIDLVDPDGF